MTPLRLRAGRIERYCKRSDVWYSRLAAHVHRYHRSECKCLAGGAACKRRREGR